MTQQRPRLYVYSGAVPWWLVLLVFLPLGAVLLTSLILAVMIAGVGTALAAFVLPLFWKRRASLDTAKTIDLDPSQYRRLDTRDR